MPRSFSALWTRRSRDESKTAPRNPQAGDAVPDVPRRAGAVLALLPQLQPASRVARHAAGDRRRVPLLPLDRVGRLLLLSLVRARHRRHGLEPRAAQGAERIQVSRALRLGVRRRRDVPDAVLPLVRAPADLALRPLPERLPALQPRRGRLDGDVPVVRRRRQRPGPDPASAAPRPAAADRVADSWLELPGAAAARRLRR